MVEDLIELADEIAHRDPTRPKSASLRRAVSTAYYAMFHALASLCAGELVGWSKPWPVFTPVYRALDHGRVKTVLLSMRRDRSGDPNIYLVVSTFLALQEARQNADYNPEPFLGRADALELIASAGQAIGVLRTFSAEVKLELAVRLLFKARP